MADFAVADPEEGLNEQGNPNPITPSGFGENLGASLNTSPSGVFGGLGFLSRALGRSSAASGVPGYELAGPGAGFLPYDLHPPEPNMSVPALQARFPDAKFKEPLPLTVATDLAKSQADAAKQANLYARYPNGFFANVPLVGSQIVAGLLDPVNDAAFMVPVVGETRYAQWLAGAGSRAGLAGRLAVTAGVGGARGVAGATILAGAEAPLAANEDQPITLGQAGRDILSAGLGGALLHTGLSFHSDVLGARFAETGEGRAAAGSADLHDSAVQTAAAQMASGRPVEVQPVFDAARTRADLLGSTALTPVERDPLAGVRTENAISRAQGAPGQDELRWAGDAQAARAEPDGLAVSEGQIAEARAAVERMRAAGNLTPEDEDMLARLEQEPPEGDGFRTNPMRIADEHDDEVRALETQAFAAAGGKKGEANAYDTGELAQGAPGSSEEAPHPHRIESRPADRENSQGAVPLLHEGGGTEAPSGLRESTTDRVAMSGASSVVARGGEVTGEAREGAGVQPFLRENGGGNSSTEFQRSRTTSGERVALNDDVIATLPTEPTAAERPILHRVAQIAGEMVPGAKVVAARTLEPGERVRDEIGGSNVTGAVYTNGARRVIAWSLESPDAEATFRHEAVHWLNKEGFFAPEEWSALEGAARTGDWIGKHDIDGRYPGLDQTGKLEEAIADEFGAWRRAPDLVPEALRPIYQKLMELLARVADFVRTTFGENATANDIFSRLASGEIGARTPAETPRYGSTAFELSPEEQARADMDKAVAARKKLTAYQDLQKRQALIESVRNFHEQTVNRPTLRHPLAGIERRLPLAQSVDALTRGISEAVKGGRESTASEQLARANDFLGGFQTALDKIDGGMSAWRSRALTKEWVRELSELNKPGGRPGVSASPMALEIARAVKQAQDVARMHLNRSGAWIGDYDGYVSRTAHNAVKIDRAGYPAWKEFTLARLDQDRTFADLDPEADRETGIDRFMHGVWDGLSTGIHLTSQEGVGKASKAGAFSGPGNLGKRLSSERVLHWADADGWREYQEKFGDQVIERGVMNTLHRAATDSALMRRWGSNPQYTFDNLLRSIKEEYRDDHEGVRTFQAAEARLREEFAYLSGAGNMTGQSLAWKIRSSVLAWQDITKLGNVLFAHFSTFATKPFQLMYHGVGPWQAYTSTLRNFVQENTPEARSTLENLRSNATGLTQNILTGYEPIDGVPGRISGLRQKMMRLGGLPWALGLQKAGTEWELANFLGQRVGQRFGDLHPATQRALALYGLGEPEWDALRGAPGHDADGSGSTYLTPQAAARAPDTVIDGLTGGRVGPDTPPADAARIRDETRDRLMMKLAAYYSESADRSTITPGVPERAVFSRIAGRFGGSIIGQYKTWATAAVRQIWGQALYGSSRGEALKAMAGVIAVGTAAGYLRTVVTDLLSGKIPRMFNGDPANDAEILIGSMVKGSGMGILGDMILGQFEANAGSGKERALKYIAQLAGPLIGDVADLGGVAFDYATAPLQKHPEKAVRSATANALHEVQQHLPLVNLFYVRTIMNWLVWDRLYEMASPGYLKRYQAHVKQMSHGQSYLSIGGYQPGAPTQYLGHATAPVAQ